MILAESLRLLDEDGIDGFSLPRLGRALGADQTAVYRHFASKDDIVLALADRLIEEAMTGFEPQECWVDTLIEMALRLRRTYLAHPAAASISAVPDHPGPGGDPDGRHHHRCHAQRRIRGRRGGPDVPGGRRFRAVLGGLLRVVPGPRRAAPAERPPGMDAGLPRGASRAAPEHLADQDGADRGRRRADIDDDPVVRHRRAHPPAPRPCGCGKHG